jgi:predicted transcriptional regulator
MSEGRKALLITQTATIVAAFVARNPMRTSELPKLIETVHRSLIQQWDVSEIRKGEGVFVPAVSAEKSVRREHLVCLECGNIFRSLRRHISTAHRQKPDQYRKKWNLPRDYPMVAPSFGKERSESALRIWEGRKKPARQPAEAGADAAPGSDAAAVMAQRR